MVSAAVEAWFWRSAWIVTTPYVIMSRHEFTDIITVSFSIAAKILDEIR